MRRFRHFHPFLWLFLPLFGGCAETRDAPVAVVTAALSEELATKDRAQVIVNLVEPEEHYTNRELRRQAIEKAQDEIIAAMGGEFTLGRRYRYVPAVAGKLTKAAIERMRSDPRVKSIQLDGTGGGQLKEAVPAIGADKVHTMLNITGKGVRVAVLDTGADTDHPDLAGAIIAQHCFTQSACPPVFGREGTSAEDDHGHGSNVTGIVASRGKVAGQGFAPAAELVLVKINDSNDSGQESDWVAGLDWVYEDLPNTHVKVVNLSIGTNALYSGNCDAQEPSLAAAIKNLTDMGVTVFAASGNRGSSTQLGAPACNTGVIAVGATYDSSQGHQPPGASTYAARWGSAFANCSDEDAKFDQITCFTNSNDRLDLVAPGAPITSDTLRGRTEMYWGTSQASPVAAGVAALMMECNSDLKWMQVKDIMQRTGVQLMDPKNGKMFASLRALEAVQMACSGRPGVGAAGAAAPAAGGGGGAVVPLAGAGAAGTAAVVPQAGALAQQAGTQAPLVAAGSPGIPAAGTVAGAARAGTGAAVVTAGAQSAVAAGSGVAMQGASASTPPPAQGCSCRAAGAEPHGATGGSASAGGLALLASVLFRQRRRSQRRAAD